MKNSTKQARFKTPEKASKYARRIIGPVGGCSKMSTDEFYGLVGTLLDSSLPSVQLRHLALALRAVVIKTGYSGAFALRDYCKARRSIDV